MAACPSGASFQSLSRDKRKNCEKSPADAINKSGKLLRAWSEIHEIQSFRFTTFPRGAKQGL